MKTKKQERTKLKYGGVPMEQALDQRGCDIVRGFLRQLLRSADIADKNNINMSGAAVFNVMKLYRERVI